MSVDSVLETIRNVILSKIPLEAGITRIEFEGPKIAIYATKPSVLVDGGENIVREIVKTLKKRVVIRADPEVRKSEHETREIILKIVPLEAEITDIYFNNETGEVEITAKKPGYVIGKDGQNLKRILLETNWRPKVIRTPPLPSKTIRQIRELLRKDADERKVFLHNIGQKIHRSIIFKDSMVRITALGGFQEVGRSAILVQTAESNILLDIGVKPSGNSDEYPFLNLGEFDIDRLDAVVITHAHLDHCGFLPFLFKYGYRGAVYVTEPTMYLMKLLQEDYIDVARREGKIVPFSKRDVATAISHTIPLTYGEVTDISPDVRLTLHEAGHIIGSAIVHLHIGRGLFNLVYTGDFKFNRTRLLDPATHRFPRAELLIMESTYGGSSDIMPPRFETERKLIEIINRTFSRNGIVLIPALAVGRAQDIMLVINDAINKNLIPKTEVFIEGMIQEVTAIHTTFPEYLSQSVRERIYHGNNPFISEYFNIVDDPEKRSEIVEVRPSIIIATSGMLTGGPVMEYLKLLAPDSRSSLVFVSYQIEGTLGRRILQGLREIPFPQPNGRINVVNLKMEVYNIEGFSGHSDRKQLLRYVSSIQPQPERIILCHGEKSKIRDLASTIRHRLRIPVIEMGNADALRVR